MKPVPFIVRAQYLEDEWFLGQRWIDDPAAWLGGIVLPQAVLYGALAGTDQLHLEGAQGPSISLEEQYWLALQTWRDDDAALIYATRIRVVLSRISGQAPDAPPSLNLVYEPLGVDAGLFKEILPAPTDFSLMGGVWAQTGLEYPFAGPDEISLLVQWSWDPAATLGSVTADLSTFLTSIAQLQLPVETGYEKLALEFDAWGGDPSGFVARLLADLASSLFTASLYQQVGAPELDLQPETLLYRWPDLDDVSTTSTAVSQFIAATFAAVTQLRNDDVTAGPAELDLRATWVFDAGPTSPLFFAPYTTDMFGGIAAQAGLTGAQDAPEALSLPLGRWIDSPADWFGALAAEIILAWVGSDQLSNDDQTAGPPELDLSLQEWIADDAATTFIFLETFTTDEAAGPTAQNRLTGAQDPPPSVSLLTEWADNAALRYTQFIPPDIFIGAFTQLQVPGAQDPSNRLDLLGVWESNPSAWQAAPGVPFDPTPHVAALQSLMGLDLRLAGLDLLSLQFDQFVVHCPGWGGPIEPSTATWVDTIAGTTIWTEADHPCP